MIAHGYSNIAGPSQGKAEDLILSLMNSKKGLPLLVIFAVVLSPVCLPSAAISAMVAIYDFPTSAGTTLPSASTDSNASSSAGTLSVGSGFTGASGVSTGSGNPVNSLFLQGAANSTEANAFTASKFIAFTLTPSVALNFTSLSFDYRRDTSTAGNMLDLYASTGSFSSGVHVAEVSLPTVSTSAFTNLSIDLSSISGLQNISVPMNFRMYIWGGTNGAAINRFDNVTLNAAAAVPEPSTVGLILVALGAGVVIRRSRKSFP